MYVSLYGWSCYIACYQYTPFTSSTFDILSWNISSWLVGQIRLLIVYLPISHRSQNLAQFCLVHSSNASLGQMTSFLYMLHRLDLSSHISVTSKVPVDIWLRGLMVGLVVSSFSCSSVTGSVVGKEVELDLGPENKIQNSLMV